MGKLGRALLRGVGAGLTSFGGSMQAKLDQEREDERLSKLDSFKERELSVREQESKLNQQRMNVANKMQLAKFNHDRFTQLMTQSEMDPGVMAKASTDLINNGMVYQNNTIEAAKFQEKKNASGQIEFAKPYAVWDMGTYNTDDETGEPITGNDGKPEYIPHKTGNGKMVFWDRDEFVTYITKNANPYEFSKYSFIEMNAKKQRVIDAKNFASLEAAKFGTAKGQTDEAVSRQKIAESKARETKLKRETEDVGKGSQNIKDMAAKELAASLRRDFPGEPITPETAMKMAKIRDNKKTRGIFRKAAEAALNPDNPATRSDFIEGGVSEGGIPREFMEKLYEEAELAYEERGEESFGSDGWFVQVFNKVASLLSGGTE
jgi:hypothetical protein